MYRVFEALDELVTIVEEARGVPMTSSCVVPRGDMLELLDEVRDALPGEVDDAQDVLDKRDHLIDKARAEAETTKQDARAEAERLVADARARAEQIVADARAEAGRTVAAGEAEFRKLTERSRTESERMVQAGREAYERAIEDARHEQARLVSQTEVVQAAHAESARIVDEAHVAADQQRAECDAYVDGKLADFAELLATTLRTVDSGRNHLRSPANLAGRSPLYDFQP